MPGVTIVRRLPAATRKARMAKRLAALFDIDGTLIICTPAAPTT